MMQNIIIIDDDQDYRNLVSTFLKKIFPDTQVTEYDPVAEGIPARDFDWSQFDFLIMDYYLCINNFTGLDLFKREQTNPSFPASIMLTGAGNEEIATKSMKFGANKYISKQGLTKTLLRESIEESYQRHQENLRKRKLIERRNHVFNKTRFYQSIDATTSMDFSATTRCLVSIEIDSNSPDKPLDLITRNSVLKHLSLISFRYLSIHHPDLCITTLTDSSLAIIMDFPAGDAKIRDTIQALHDENIKNPWLARERHPVYSLITSALLISTGGLDKEAISEQFKQAREIARSGAGHRIYFQQAELIREIPAEPAPQPEARTEPKPAAKPAPQPEARAEPKPAAKPAPQPEARAEPKPAAKPAPQPEARAAPKPTAKPEAAPDKQPAAGAGKYEIKLDASKLSDHDRKLIEALDESRIVQVFQPVMLLNTEQFNFEEIFHVSLQLVDKGGEEESARDVFSNHENPEVSKYIDRWMIKESFSQIVDAGPDKQTQMFLIRLSTHSLADTTLFNWLRELLSGVDGFKPGESMGLEIAISDLINNQKQVTALIQYLSKNYGFSFAFGHINDAGQIKQIIGMPGRKMLMLNAVMMTELKTIPVEEDPEENFVNHMKQKNVSLIARDIDDSMALMEAISAGADMAMGTFVGEPQTQLDESSNIESYDLENHLGSTLF